MLNMINMDASMEAAICNCVNGAAGIDVAASQVYGHSLCKFEKQTMVYAQENQQVDSDL